MVARRAEGGLLELEHLQLILHRIEGRLKHWVSANGGGPLELADVAHGLDRNETVLLLAVDVDVVAYDFRVGTEVDSVNTLGVELVLGRTDAVALDDLHARPSGLRVVSLEQERVAVDQTAEQAQSLHLSEREAASDVALLRPVAEVLFVLRGLLRVLRQGLRHEAVTDGDQHHLVHDLLVGRRVADTPSALADHLHAVDRGQVLPAVSRCRGQKPTARGRLGRARVLAVVRPRLLPRRLSCRRFGCLLGGHQRSMR